MVIAKMLWRPLVAAARKFPVVLGDRILIPRRHLGRICVANRPALLLFQLSPQLQLERVHAADELLMHLLNERGIPRETARIQLAHLIDQRLEFLLCLRAIL